MDRPIPGCQYLRPLITRKLERWVAWGGGRSTGTDIAPWDGDIAVAVFVSLQCAVLLEAAEIAVFEKLCLHSLRNEFRWYPESYLAARVAEECARCVWRETTVDEIVSLWCPTEVS